MRPSGLSRAQRCNMIDPMKHSFDVIEKLLLYMIQIFNVSRTDYSVTVL